MPQYNTDNPLGSMDPRDLFDNAEVLDQIVNGSEITYSDRLGNHRSSISALLSDAEDKVENAVTSLVENVNNRQYDTYAAMAADLSPANRISAIVTNDPTDSNNGWYYKNGNSGVGSWERLKDQPILTSKFQPVAENVEQIDSTIDRRNVPGYALLFRSDDGASAPLRITDSGITEVDRLSIGVTSTLTPKVIPGIGLVFEDLNGQAALVLTTDGRIKALYIESAELRVAGQKLSTASAARLTDKYVRNGEVVPMWPNMNSASGWGSSSMFFLNDQMADMFGRVNAKAKYYNGGQIGELSMHIAGRLGSIPFQVTIDGGSIPASGAVTVTGKNVTPTSALKAFSGTLLGIPGTLTSSDTALTFTRLGSGQAVTSSSTIEFIPDEGPRHRSDVMLLWMGKNDLNAGSTVASVLDYTNRSFDWLYPMAKRCLVLGHFSDTQAEVGGVVMQNINAINAAYASRYGDLFIDVNALILSAQIWTMTGITPTSTDLQQQASGVKPSSLSRDNYHLNEAANAAIATVILQRIRTLEWYT